MQMTSMRTNDGETDSMQTALLDSRRCNSSGNLYLFSLAAVASVGGFLFVRLQSKRMFTGPHPHPS